MRDLRMSGLKKSSRLPALSLYALLSMLSGIISCGSKTTTEPIKDFTYKYSEVVRRSFSVGDAPGLVVENFVGKVTVGAGSEGTVQVAATKLSAREEDLDLIEIEMTELEGGVQIRTDKPSTLQNVAVEIKITAPAVAQLNLSVGVGDIDYQGRPQGSCSLEAGVGSIKLSLPADIEVRVDLATGVGSIELGFPVDGQVSDRIVSGAIGSGDEGDIHAYTGVGDIDLNRQ